MIRQVNWQTHQLKRPAYGPNFCQCVHSLEQLGRLPENCFDEFGLTKCDAKNLLLSQNGVLYFRTCEDGAGWHLIPCRISPRSEFLSQAYKNWHIMWGINLGLDWPPLARGSKFHTIHTPTKATKLPPLDNGRYGPLGWDVIILIIVVGNSGFPCDILKELIGQF